MTTAPTAGKNTKTNRFRNMPAWLSGVGALLAGIVAVVSIVVAGDDGSPAKSSTEGGVQVTIASLSHGSDVLQAEGNVRGLAPDWKLFLVATDDPQEVDWSYSPPAKVDDGGIWKASLRKAFGETYKVKVALAQVAQGAGTWAAGGHVMTSGIGGLEAALKTHLGESVVVLDISLDDATT